MNRSLTTLAARRRRGARGVRALVIDDIRDALRPYSAACRQ
jgi:hypothetical protein